MIPGIANMIVSLLNFATRYDKSAAETPVKFEND